MTRTAQVAMAFFGLVAWAGTALGQGPPVCPGEGDCCQDNGTPGCDDEECCTLVCDVDPFCCKTEWDGICADQAQKICDVCAP